MERLAAEAGDLAAATRGHALRAALAGWQVSPQRGSTFAERLVAAHADAKRKAEAANAEEMQKLTAGLPIPPGMKLPF